MELGTRPDLWQLRPKLDHSLVSALLLFPWGFRVLSREQGVSVASSVRRKDRSQSIWSVLLASRLSLAKGPTKTLGGEVS